MSFPFLSRSVVLGKILVAVVLCIIQSAKCQTLNNPIESLRDRKEFIFGIDNRITEINNRFGIIYGLYSGIGYGENLRVKFSISGTPFELGKKTDQSVHQRSNLLFISVGQEIDFFTIGRFNLTTYLNAGLEYHYYRNLSADNLEIASGRDLIRPLELGLHGRYQMTRLVAFKAGGGWRFVFPDKSDHLSGYYVKLTAVLNPKVLIEILKDRKAQKRSE